VVAASWFFQYPGGQGLLGSFSGGGGILGPAHQVEPGDRLNQIEQSAPITGSFSHTRTRVRTCAQSSAPAFPLMPTSLLGSDSVIPVGFMSERRGAGWPNSSMIRPRGNPNSASALTLRGLVARMRSRSRRPHGPAQFELEFIVEPIFEVVVDVHTYRTPRSPELTSRLRDSST
jgi:hypothetical protein